MEENPLIAACGRHKTAIDCEGWGPYTPKDSDGNPGACKWVVNTVVRDEGFGDLTVTMHECLPQPLLPGVPVDDVDVYRKCQSIAVASECRGTTECGWVRRPAQCKVPRVPIDHTFAHIV